MAKQILEPVSRAERSMLLTTGGVNTRRGAIWTLGLLVSAAAMVRQRLAVEWRSS